MKSNCNKKERLTFLRYFVLKMRAILLSVTVQSLSHRPQWGVGGGGRVLRKEEVLSF